MKVLLVDPFAEIVMLLQPGAAVSKLVSGAGRWSVSRSEQGRPFYCVILHGAARLAVDGAAIVLQAGDFVLIPSAGEFTMSGFEPAPRRGVDGGLIPGEIRHGRQDGPPDVQLRVGYCSFGSPDAALLVALLPRFLHVRDDARLGVLAQLVAEESRVQRPARDVVLARLLEVLLIEALRSAQMAASPGLLRGLGDERLSCALRAMHQTPSRRWTIALLAREAALSRSAFFERFSRAVGVAPIAYLLAWRMAIARSLLRRHDGDVADIAERVGYGSASAFSVAFTRHVGSTPSRYARMNTSPRGDAGAHPVF